MRVEVLVGGILVGDILVGDNTNKEESDSTCSKEPDARHRHKIIREAT